MIIEIIGSPGSGKSYYCKNKKEKKLKKRNYFNFISLNFMKFLIIINLINIHQTFFKAKYLSFLKRIILFLEKNKLSFEYYNNYINAKKKNLNKVYKIYLDDGLIQFFFVLLESEKNLKIYFDFYLHFIPEIDFIIILKCNNKKILKENMDKRKRWPRKKYGIKYFEYLLDKQILYFKIISEDLIKRKKEKVKIIEM